MSSFQQQERHTKKHKSTALSERKSWQKPFLKKPRHSWDLLDKDVKSTILKYAQRAKGNHVQRIKGNWEKCCVNKTSVSIKTEMTERSQIQIL